MSSKKTAESNRSVGLEVLAYCTSCRMDLNHLIVAMKGDQIAKVECKTCKKTHVYRAPKGVTEPGEKKEKGENTDRRTIEMEWEKLRAAKSGAPSKNYNFKQSYLLGDKIGHPNFGEGFVAKLVFPNKIQVVFKDDVRLLIHGKS